MTSVPASAAEAANTDAVVAGSTLQMPDTTHPTEVERMEPAKW